MDLPEFSQHATARWNERCSGLHFPSEWATVRRCGRKIKRKIMLRCPAHAHLMRNFLGFWYGISRNRVIFVVDRNQQVVTVFMLEPLGQQVVA